MNYFINPPAFYRNFEKLKTVLFLFLYIIFLWEMSRDGKENMSKVKQQKFWKLQDEEF